MKANEWVNKIKNSEEITGILSEFFRETEELVKQRTKNSNSQTTGAICRQLTWNKNPFYETLQMYCPELYKAHTDYLNTFSVIKKEEKKDLPVGGDGRKLAEKIKKQRIEKTNA
jgi:23S rRNA maturation mini-RNase III